MYKIKIQALLILISAFLPVTKDVLFHNSSPVPLAVFTCSATTVGMSWTTNAVDCYEVPDTATLLDTAWTFQ